jgi:hypothetical protein
MRKAPKCVPSDTSLLLQLRSTLAPTTIAPTPLPLQSGIPIYSTGKRPQQSLFSSKIIDLWRGDEHLRIAFSFVEKWSLSKAAGGGLSRSKSELWKTNLALENSCRALWLCILAEEVIAKRAILLRKKQRYFISSSQKR